MSEAIIFENMPYNLFLKQRMEFVVICQDHLAANVMRVVEAEMIKRKEAWQARAEKALDEKKPQPKEPKTYWVRMSLSQIIARLYMFDSAKLKKPESEDLESEEWKEYRFKKALSISKGTLRKAIDHLKSLGFLIERSKPGDEFGAPIWTLHKENVQKSLKSLPQNPFTIFHALGGGSKFEYGGEVQNLNVPPPNFECGDSQILNVPGALFEPGEVQNLEVDIDNSIDTLLDLEIDNEIEDTYPAPSSPSQPSDANASTHAQSEQDEPYVLDFTANHTTSQEKQANEQQSTKPPAQDIPRTAEFSANAGQAELSTADVEKAAASVEKPKRTRAPRPPKIDPEEMDLYRRVFDDCFKEATEDESVGYAHTKASNKCISDLLEMNRSRPKFVTPQKLHAVYVRMWNLPKDERSGFWWREHMSIKSVCNNYEAHAMVLAAAAREKQQQSAMSVDDLKRKAIAHAQSGELAGGVYRYIQSDPSYQPHYLTADQRAALFGGK